MPLCNTDRLSDDLGNYFDCFLLLGNFSSEPVPERNTDCGYNSNSILFCTDLRKSRSEAVTLLEKDFRRAGEGEQQLYIAGVSGKKNQRTRSKEPSLRL